MHDCTAYSDSTCNGMHLGPGVVGPVGLVDIPGAVGLGRLVDTLLTQELAACRHGMRTGPVRHLLITAKFRRSKKLDWTSVIKSELSSTSII